MTPIDVTGVIPDPMIIPVKNLGKRVQEKSLDNTLELATHRCNDLLHLPIFAVSLGTTIGVKGI